MVLFDAGDDDLDSRLPELAQLVEEVLRRPVEADDEGRLVVLPCAFDGPDLDEVAERAGCTPERVVELLTGQTLTVAMVGFSPGFAYMTVSPRNYATSPGALDRARRFRVDRWRWPTAMPPSIHSRRRAGGSSSVDN